MGGGGGGYFPPIDIAKLTEKANRRIQGALEDTRVTVFVCAPADVRRLESLIVESGFSQRSYQISSVVDLLKDELAQAGLVVFFVDRSEDHVVIDTAIPIAAELRVPNFFVHSRIRYSQPNRVLQFRVRSMSWDQLLEIVIGV